MSTVEEDGALHVEGEYIGRISGFRFMPDGASDEAGARALKAAALQAVAAEIVARAGAVAACADPDLSLTPHGDIIWNHGVIGRVESGSSMLKPRAVVVAGDQLGGPERDNVQARLQKFVDRHVAGLLEPLIKLEEGEGLDGLVRGLAFRIAEQLGIVPREQVAEDVKSLSQEDRARLRALGVRFGAFHIFTPLMLKPAATDLRLLLWALQQQKENRIELSALPKPPGQGLTSAPFDRSTPRGFYGVCGYRICGNRVVRIDMLERLADLIRDRVFWRPRIPEEQRPAGSVEGGGFTVVPDMMSLVGCSGEEFENILRSLGFRMQRRTLPTPAATPAVPDTRPAEDSSSTQSANQNDLDVNGKLPPQETTPSPEPEMAVPDTPDAHNAENGTTAEPAEATPSGPQEIQIWWPRDTGPFRRRPEQKPAQEQPRHKKKRRQGEVNGKDPIEKRLDTKKNRDRRPNERPAPVRTKPERPVDPNSPFAVLGALKAKLAGNKS